MLINDLPYIMIKCLICTIIIELIGALIIGLRKKDLLYVVLVNTMTNPLVVTLPIFMLVKFGITARYICLLLMEIFAVISEGFVYKKVLTFKKLNPYLISLILNVLSYCIGVIINNLF
jgi:hypothetical protein